MGGELSMHLDLGVGRCEEGKRGMVIGKEILGGGGMIGGARLSRRHNVNLRAGRSHFFSS